MNREIKETNDIISIQSQIAQAIAEELNTINILLTKNN